jgi:hypothetical protein
MAGAQLVDDRVGVAAADGGGEIGDGAAEAMDAPQDDDPVADRRGGRRGVIAGGGADDVAEDGTGFDGGQLVGVTDEDQASVNTDGVDEVSHHRRRHHRRPSTITTSYGSRLVRSWRNRLPGRQPRSRCSVDAQFSNRPDRRCDVEVACWACAASSSGRLPGRGGSASWRRPCRIRLSSSRTDDPGDGRRLAGSLPPATTEQRPNGKDAARRCRSVSSAPNSSSRPPPSAPTGDRCPAGQETAGDAALLAPVAVEVKPPPQARGRFREARDRPRRAGWGRGRSVRRVGHGRSPRPALSSFRIARGVHVGQVKRERGASKRRGRRRGAPARPLPGEGRVVSRRIGASAP